MKPLPLFIVVFIHAALFPATGAIAQQSAISPATEKISLLERPVPALESLPDDAYGKLVRYGHELATRTYAYIGPEVKNPQMRYAGNNLSCTSCHQADAAKPYAMPWTGAFANHPRYLGRPGRVGTLEDRVNGCMERSMNGKAIPLDSEEMRAFVTYMHFLSRGIPVGADLIGASTKGSKPPNRRADPTAGERVFKTHCVACHGEDGAGKRNGIKGDAQGYLFPPLWGDDSFSNGAGMNRLLVVMRFAKHNMPQGVSHTSTVLTDDEAYDVAAYVVSKPRKELSGMERDFPDRWSKPVDAAYPPYMEGFTADQHKYGPFGPLLENAKRMAAGSQKQK